MEFKEETVGEEIIKVEEKGVSYALSGALRGIIMLIQSSLS